MNITTSTDETSTNELEKETFDKVSKKQKRACFHCYTKKVKCSGDEPCEYCRNHDLNCYKTAPKKRGPSRGSKLQLLRDEVTRLQKLVEEKGPDTINSAPLLLNYTPSPISLSPNNYLSNDNLSLMSLTSLSRPPDSQIGISTDISSSSSNMVQMGKRPLSKAAAAFKEQFLKSLDPSAADLAIDAHIPKPITEHTLLQPTIITSAPISHSSSATTILALAGVGPKSAEPHTGTFLINTAKPTMLRPQSLKKSVSPLLQSPLNTNLQGWTAFDFYLEKIIDPKSQSEMNFWEYYFKVVYIDIPILSKSFCDENAAILPPLLLHAIYATLLLYAYPNDFKMKEKAKQHIQTSIKMIHWSLENATPFYCAALLHIILFNQSINDASCCIHIALAAQIAIELGMDSDKDILWFSPTGSVFKSVDMCRGIWMMIFSFDFYIHVLYGIPLCISGPIAPKVVYNYTSINWEHPTNIPGNFLTYFKNVLPLINISKRKLVFDAQTEDGSQDTFEKLLNDFDHWFNNLPPSFRYTPTDVTWKNRFIGHMNILYFSNRLDLLRPFFIAHVRGLLQTPLSESYFNSVLVSVEVVTSICRGFVEYKRNGGTEMPNQYMDMSTLIFTSALYLLVILSHCTDIDQTIVHSSLQVHIDVLEVVLDISDSKVRQLKRLRSMPFSAIDILQNN